MGEYSYGVMWRATLGDFPGSVGAHSLGTSGAVLNSVGRCRTIWDCRNFELFGGPTNYPMRSRIVVPASSANQPAPHPTQQAFRSRRGFAAFLVLECVIHVRFRSPLSSV